MDLAAHLGMTVARLRAEMTLREMLLWRVKWNTDPWGERRADLRMARICQTLAEINRDRRKYPEPIKLDAFALFKEPEAEEPEEPRRQRGARISADTIAWLDMMAGKPLPKGKPNGH